MYNAVCLHTGILLSYNSVYNAACMCTSITCACRGVHSVIEHVLDSTDALRIEAT
jgi:hypothetical protein